MPFAREIMLVECHIAGTTHREIKDIESSLTPGALLVLKREPANPHDALAIMIFAEAGHHLGYVPCVKNEALARLMDAGKLLFAKLESKRWQGDWAEGRGAHSLARHMSDSRSLMDFPSAKDRKTHLCRWPLWSHTSFT